MTFGLPLTETLYHFGDNDRERWDPLFSLYQLPPLTLPNKDPVLSFGLAGTCVLTQQTIARLGLTDVELWTGWYGCADSANHS